MTNKFQIPNLKIAFMGTPEVAAKTLEGLAEAGFPVSAVITRPDKPQKRSSELVASEVKITAQKNNLPVYQPTSKLELVEVLGKIKPDLAIVVAFGMILPQEALDIPKYGMVNIHYSLLPKYRGAAPYVDVILNGDEKTGVTLSEIVLALDAGDIIDQKRIPLSGKETQGSLLAKLTEVGTELLINSLPKWVAGELKSKPQKGTSTFTKMIKKEDGKIDWKNMTAEQIERMSRAYDPWPGVYSFWNGKKIDFYDIHINPQLIYPVSSRPGLVLTYGSGSIIIQTKKGLVSPRFLKIEGKNKVAAADFLRGYPEFKNSVLI